MYLCLWNLIGNPGCEKFKARFIVRTESDSISLRDSTKNSSDELLEKLNLNFSPSRLVRMHSEAAIRWRSLTRIPLQGNGRPSETIHEPNQQKLKTKQSRTGLSFEKGACVDFIYIVFHRIWGLKCLLFWIQKFIKQK